MSIEATTFVIETLHECVPISIYAEVAKWQDLISSQLITEVK